MSKAQSDTPDVKPAMLRNHDKMNSVDFHWFIVRTLPHQERKLAGLLRMHQEETKNILEVYCPTHTTVSMVQDGNDVAVPLFAGFVFVLSTQEALLQFIGKHYPEGRVLYERKKEPGQKARLWTVPESQMRAFKDFNENYAENVVILERPYSDYAFNPKTGESNDIVRVIDGPLAGREGYLARFRRDKRLVFKMKSLAGDSYYTVSVPNVWHFHVVRLHNAEGDRMTVWTMKERAVDLIIGILQWCGYRENALTKLYEMVDALAVKPSLVGLSRALVSQGDGELGNRMASLDAPSAELILNLVRYEHDNPGFVRSNWGRLVIRPFLTPTSGQAVEGGELELALQHTHFTEIIRKVEITEQVYYPRKDAAETAVTTYYAHIGISSVCNGEGQESGIILFANWDYFLREYFMTGGNANKRLVEGTVRTGHRRGVEMMDRDKLIDSFRNYSPTLYKVLTDAASPVKAVKDYAIGNETINVMAVKAAPSEISQAKDELINTCICICQEINTTTHLSLWRRYLRTVWLHK